MSRTIKLGPVCTFMGSKRLFATQIAAEILRRDPEHVYDLCCGSGAVSIALVREGYPVEQLTMVDIGPWGDVWVKLSAGEINLSWLHDFMFKNWPTTGSSEHMREFARVAPYAVEVFLLLQMTSRGGLPTTWDGKGWRNSSKSEPWTPRGELHRERENMWARLLTLMKLLKGVGAKKADVSDLRGEWNRSGGLRYLDPPYRGTRAYGAELDLESYLAWAPRPILVSEQRELVGADRILTLGSRAAKSLGGGRTDAIQELLHVYE